MTQDLYEAQLEAIRAELAPYFVTEERCPGDMISQEIADAFGLALQSGLRKMKQIVKAHPDKYQLVMVRGKGSPMWVLRRKSPESREPPR